MQIKQKNGTRIICLLLLLIGMLFYYQTYSFPKEIGLVASEYGSAFFPRLLLIFIATMAVILIGQSTLRRFKASADLPISMSSAQIARCLGLWLICLAFYLAWLYIGYLYASSLFMLAIGWLMGARRIAILAFLASLGPLMYVVFEQLLKVSL